MKRNRICRAYFKERKEKIWKESKENVEAPRHVATGNDAFAPLQE